MRNVSEPHNLITSYKHQKYLVVCQSENVFLIFFRVFDANLSVHNTLLYNFYKSYIYVFRHTSCDTHTSGMDAHKHMFG